MKFSSSEYPQNKKPKTENIDSYNNEETPKVRIPNYTTPVYQPLKTQDETTTAENTRNSRNNRNNETNTRNRMTSPPRDGADMPMPPANNGRTMPTPAPGNGRTMPPAPGNGRTTPTPAPGNGRTMPPAPGNGRTMPTPAPGNGRTTPPAPGNGRTMPAPAPGNGRTMPTPAPGNGRTIPPAPSNGRTMPAPAPGNGRTMPTPAPGNGRTIPPAPGNGRTMPTPAPGNGRTTPPMFPDNGMSMPAPGNGRTMPTPFPNGGMTMPTPNMPGNLNGMNNTASSWPRNNDMWDDYNCPEQGYMCDPYTRPYNGPVGVPLMPLYGYDNSEDADKDWEYIRQMYPKTSKKILIEIECECDKLEYDGSCMFDEYPDRVYLGKIIDRIYTKMQDSIEEPLMYSNSIESSSSCEEVKEEKAKKDKEDIEVKQYRRDNNRRNNRNTNWLRDLIEVLFYQEILNRRRRYRSRRRWF